MKRNYLTNTLKIIGLASLFFACGSGSTATGSSGTAASSSGSSSGETQTLKCSVDTSTTCEAMGLALNFECNDPAEFALGGTLGCKPKTANETNDLCCPSTVQPDPTLLACQPKKDGKNCKDAARPKEASCDVDTQITKSTELGCKESAVKGRYCCPASVTLPP
jgi:hypothetical protein